MGELEWTCHLVGTRRSCNRFHILACSDLDMREAECVRSLGRDEARFQRVSGVWTERKGAVRPRRRAHNESAP
jgi:hypothetical protein